MGTKKEIQADIDSHQLRIDKIKTTPKLASLAYMLPVYERLVNELKLELSEKGTKLK